MDHPAIVEIKIAQGRNTIFAFYFERHISIFEGVLESNPRPCRPPAPESANGTSLAANMYHSQVPEVLFQRLLPDKLVFAEQPFDLKSLRGHQEVVQAVDRHLDVAGVDEVQDRLLIIIFLVD